MRTKTEYDILMDNSDTMQVKDKYWIQHIKKLGYTKINSDNMQYVDKYRILLIKEEYNTNDN